jgi:hypothetical protein
VGKSGPKVWRFTAANLPDKGGSYEQRFGVEANAQEVAPPNQRYGEEGRLGSVFRGEDEGAPCGGKYGIFAAEGPGEERFVKGVLDMHCSKAKEIGGDNRQSKDWMFSKKRKSPVSE